MKIKKNLKKKRKKGEYNEIISKFNKLFEQIESKDSNKTLYDLCDKLKNKHKEKLINDKIPTKKTANFNSNFNPNI